MKKETLTVKTDIRGTITYRNDSGQLHNPHGSAVVYSNGDKSYYVNGKLHNTDGPAVVWADGYIRYCINGKRLSEAEFKEWKAKQPAPLHNTTTVIGGVEYTLIAK